MTTLPLMIAKTATSLIVSFAPLANQNADFNNDGVVDTNDLVSLVANLNQVCEECQTDLNLDGITDASDILALMGQWGDVPGYVAEERVEDNSETTASTENLDLSWQGQGPVLLDAIYYDELSRNADRRALGSELNQGEQAKSWTQANGIAVQPMVYNGGVDWYVDGEYCDDDKRRFNEWLDANVPADYEGPICLDMEAQWWPLFETSSQVVMDTIVDYYIEGLEYAQAQRPNAKFGYWGLPKKSHTKVTSTTADVSRLLQASTALFPDVYDFNPTGNGAARLQLHIETTMKMVDGKVPVYVQASPRYKDTNNEYTMLHTVEEFMHDQVDAALAAVYTDEDGKEHRISGVALWDAYVYFWWYTENWTLLTSDTQKAMWDELDAYHVTLLEEMKMSVDVAYAAAEERLVLETQEETQMTSALEEDTATAKADEITVLKVQQQQNKSQLVGQVRTAKTSIKRASSSFKGTARSYRSARKQWSRARRAFAEASRKYAPNSSKYQQALAKYEAEQDKMQSFTQSYQQERDNYRSARASINQARAQWKATNSQLVETQSTLQASM